MAPNITSSKPISPNEYLGIPQWINEDYFLPILEKDIPHFSKITSFTPIAATAPGDNYASVMVRVMLDIETKDGVPKQISYILKTTLDANNKGAAIISSLNLFPKEKQMYQSILPKFENLYAAAGISIQFAPKCLLIEEVAERITLVMEDLQRKKFVNKDRLKGFDMAHITRVLEKLAELHAASAVYYELNGPYDEIYNVGLHNKANRERYLAFASSRQTLLPQAMREWGLENVEYYIAKVPPVDVHFDEETRLNEIDANEFNVLNHGDTWLNNIMFNYNANGDIDETLFVDYQVGKWGTPAQDLWYMIMTSASLDIKVKEFDHFIYIYHKCLMDCLKLLKYTKAKPSLKELHAMMLKYGLWGYNAAQGTMSIALLPPEKDANIESFMKSGPEADAFRLRRLKNPYYVKAMCQLYPFFEYKGILEIFNNNS